MVRQRQHLVAGLGKYRDAIAWIGEMNTARRRLGLPEWTTWTPVAGDFNYLILECEYPSLAELKSGEDKFQGDPETMTIFRRGIEWGSKSHWPRDEVLLSAENIA